jgi:hypothetical protein
MRAWRIAAALLLLLARPAPAQSDLAGAWADWGAVLTRYASGENVQYARWKAENPAEWRRFLAWLETADPSRLPLADQRAFWINAYNARAVAGVLDRYPIDSVRDVGFLGGRVRGFFGRKEHRVAGQRRSLDDIHAIVTRPPLGDLRVHFALCLAAEGSPPLRPEPYRGANLDTQLDFQTRTFLNGPAGSRLDKPGQRLYLTPIFAWHEGEFHRDGGSVRSFAARYLMGAAGAAAASDEWRIEWLDFDWRLNEPR